MEYIIQNYKKDKDKKYIITYINNSNSENLRSSNSFFTRGRDGNRGRGGYCSICGEYH